MKPTKILNSLTFIIMLSALFGTSLSNNDALMVKAEGTQNGQQKYGYNEDAELVSPEEFKIQVQSSSKTETSHSYTMKFVSSVSTIFTQTKPYNGVYLATNDPLCPMDMDDLKKYVKYDIDVNNINESLIAKDEDGNPILDENGMYTFVDKDGVVHDYSFKIPVYEAYVYRLEPSDLQSEIVIPNYVNRSDRYILNITEIGSNVFNHFTKKDGSTQSYLKNIKNIYIGSHATTIHDDAFKAITDDKTDVNINIIGEQSSYTLGENWSGNGNVNFSYNLSEDTILDSKTKAQVQKIYDTSLVSDDDGNLLYYDEYGRRITSDGVYVDSDGNPILDEDGQPTVYDGAALTLEKCRSIKIAFNTPKQFVASSSFVFGAKDRPMVLEYSYTTKNGETVKAFYEFVTDTVEGVGNAAGVPSVTKYVDIRIGEGEEINSDSLIVRNIFKDGAGEGLDADTSLESEFKCAPEKLYRSELSIDQFINVHDQKIRKFGEYTSFSFVADKVKDIYPVINPSSWNQYQNKVASGNIKIRYSFVNFNAASYIITYLKNGELTTKTVSFNDSAEDGLTLNFHLLTQDENNVVTFLLKNKLIDEDFNANTVKKVEYKGLSIKLDLMNTKKGTTQIVTKSDVVTRFGYFDILSDNSDINVFNADVFMIISSILFIVVYAVIAVVYYFYAKNKYKNDEFRRVNTKRFIKKSLINFVGGGIIYLALNFILLRFGFFNVSVIVYNPLDPLVVIVGVVAIVVFGLFMKNLVTYIKTEKERRRALRLKLNEDVLDDGTK